MRRPFLLLVLTACGGAAHVRRTHPVEVVVSRPAGPLASGWAVEALVGTASFAGLRFSEGEVLLSRRFNPLDLLVSPAFAHPGHYEPGATRGELLTGLTLDLSSSEPRAWGVANAITGTYGSAELLFHAASLRVQGTATKGERRVRFDTGLLELDRLRPIPVGHELSTDPGTMRLELDLGVLLSRIDFEATGSAPDANGVVTFSPSSVAFNGFERGATDTASYRFTWLPN